MKFHISCHYNFTKNNYTTTHTATGTVEALSAVQAVTQFLDDLANESPPGTITGLDIKVVHWGGAR